MDNDEDHQYIISQIPIVVQKRSIKGKSIYDYNPYVKSRVPTDISSEEKDEIAILESFKDAISVPKHVLSFNENNKIASSYTGHEVGILDANSLKTTIDYANDEILDRIDKFAADYAEELDKKDLLKTPNIQGYWDADLEDEYDAEAPMINKPVTNLDYSVPFHEATDRGEYGDIERFEVCPTQYSNSGLRKAIRGEPNEGAYQFTSKNNKYSNLIWIIFILVILVLIVVTTISVQTTHRGDAFYAVL
jgi:hypothetical protein